MPRILTVVLWNGGEKSSSFDANNETGSSSLVLSVPLNFYGCLFCTGWCSGILRTTSMFELRRPIRNGMAPARAVISPRMRKHWSEIQLPGDEFDVSRLP